MTAQLAATVYVKDPDTRQTAELAEGTCPEDRLARLVTSPAAWVDGKMPPAAKNNSDDGAGQDDASGARSASADADHTARDTDKAAPAAKKTAAPKRAATSRSRGRDAAEGDSGE